MTNQEIIAVVEASESGKEIQFRDKRTENWLDCKLAPEWNFASREYRVKPEPPKPRDFWLALYGSGVKPDAFCSKVGAEAFCRITQLSEPLIHVREVLE